ncbi:hypothetical protein STCU_12351 [Strigomonas culicis]|uniref:Uncharacterized protein n=1 Tax=Strigomonas culicis TaxID=28005 RepID=S9TDU4_9TRYP|nr:hypothetical protein STCU_12351 [Strigomonas culicis]|eukprot:EPY15094.1 hypothetical protein STCU_12351 [Strigomonas culicis]
MSKKTFVDVGEVAEIPEDVPSARESHKKLHICAMMKEVHSGARPLFRLQNAASVYGETTYHKKMLSRQDRKMSH